MAKGLCEALDKPKKGGGGESSLANGKEARENMGWRQRAGQSRTQNPDRHTTTQRAHATLSPPRSLTCVGIVPVSFWLL